jgi:hypothetical protein
VGDGFSVAGQGACIDGDLLGEFMGDGGEEAAVAVTGLMEIVGAKVPCRQQSQRVAFDHRTEWFKEVQSKAVPILLIGVHNPETRVESEGDRGEPAFDFGERVAVVQQRVDRVRGLARGAAAGVQWATAGGVDAPMFRDPVGLVFGEAAGDVRGPGTEVGVAG